MFRLGISALALSFAVVTPARADDDTTADVRCLVVSAMSVATQDSWLAAAGTLSAFYWLGRLDGRTPDLDLENRVLEQVHSLSPNQLAAEAQRCGELLKDRGAFLTRMGQDLVDKGKAEEQLKNSR